MDLDDLNNILKNEEKLHKAKVKSLTAQRILLKRQKKQLDQQIFKLTQEINDNNHEKNNHELIKEEVNWLVTMMNFLRDHQATFVIRTDETELPVSNQTGVVVSLSPLAKIFNLSSPLAMPKIERTTWVEIHAPHIEVPLSWRYKYDHYQSGFALKSNNLLSDSSHINFQKIWADHNWGSLELGVQVEKMMASSLIADHYMNTCVYYQSLSPGTQTFNADQLLSQYENITSLSKEARDKIITYSESIILSSLGDSDIRGPKKSRF